MYGAIEAGGTKFVCAIGTDTQSILERKTIPTTTPNETIDQVESFFKNARKKYGDLSFSAIGSFGPIGVHAEKSDYGIIKQTTKPGWSQFNIKQAISQALETPVVIDTDVNCALIGEASYGAGKGFNNLIYMTFGTGIGGGILIDGKILKGFSHPEIGHMFASRHPEDTNFKGVCAFHGNKCYEGLASGPAIFERWQAKGQNLDPSHPAWKIQSYYAASLCLSLIQILSPDRVILGGGVMQQAHLFPMIRKDLTKLLANYIDLSAHNIDVEHLISPVALNGDAAIIGCILMAKSAYEQQTQPNK